MAAEEKLWSLEERSSSINCCNLRYYGRKEEAKKEAENPILEHDGQTTDVTLQTISYNRWCVIPTKKEPKIHLFIFISSDHQILIQILKKIIVFKYTKIQAKMYLISWLSW